VKGSAVLFDLDGVLIDSLRYHIRAWEAVFDPYGIQIPERRLYLDEGRPSEDTARDLNREYALGLDERALELLLERKRALFREIAPQGMLSSARRVVRALRARNWRTALVTGSARDNVTAMLAAPDLLEFDAVVTAEDYARGKPDPEPYLTACRRLHLPPQVCIAVENAPHGIVSARAAGVRVVALTSTLPEADLGGADVVISQIGELLDILE
jgi:beta-phosphoglucomutase